MSDETAVRVFLVAPAIVRWGLERLLSAAPNIEVSGSSHSLVEAAQEIESQFPDVVVVDGDDCSHEDIRAVYARARVRIVALASGTDTEAVGTGHTWVNKRGSPSSFVRAILDTAGAPQGRPPALRIPAAQTVHPTAPLTRKQTKVVEVMVANPSAPAKVVAGELCMSEHTLRNHLSEIYSKLQVSGRLGLQALVRQQPGSWERAC
jgi:two-component system, NarL family, nitrate/nitrite response regulator NarL